MSTKPTANELRALVAELKPRSPQEVMGAAASSNLMSSMFTAAVTGIGLLLCATILMFSLGFGPTAQADSKPSDVADASATSTNSTNSTEKDADTAPATTSADQAAEPETAATANSENKSQTSGSTDKAIEAMGIGETADPDSKPDSLENRLDKILDGIE